MAAALCAVGEGRRPTPVRKYVTKGQVEVLVFDEGESSLPAVRQDSTLHVWYVGRLPGGAVFDATRGKRPQSEPFEMALGQGKQIRGMEEGLQGLHVGARVELRIPNKMAYGQSAIPPGTGNMIPAGSDLRFEIDLLRVDGIALPEAQAAPPSSSVEQLLSHEEGPLPMLKTPAWLVGSELPAPAPEYISFCRHVQQFGLAFQGCGALARAEPLPRHTAYELEGWDGTQGGVICEDMTSQWPALKDWSLDYFRERFGGDRALVKWIGPIFPNENLWERPVLETSVAEYLDYVRALERCDPDCAEERAATCPRFYLNGWQVMLQHPELRRAVRLPGWLDDVTREIYWKQLQLVDGVQAALMGRKGAASVAELEARKEQVLRDDWELVKLFLSPKGSITRLHYDNGRAHAWLTQLKGRKLFVCYRPQDTEHLSPFTGDEGLRNASPIDPLEQGNEARWPGYAKATPLVGIVEEGETIMAPVGWWHYAVALTPSVTLMRNFWSHTNRHEIESRKEGDVAKVAAGVLQQGGNAKLKGQPLPVLEEFCRTHLFPKIKAQIAAEGDDNFAKLLGRT